MSRLDGPKMVYGAPIYPVPVKPPSGINSWEGWPHDVVRVLKTWNSGQGLRGPGKVTRRHHLSFRRSQTGSIFEPHLTVFKCVDCLQFCKPHGSGAAQLDGDWLCDDCLIARARAYLAEIGQTDLNPGANASGADK
jgi:hypothetical protein